MKNIVSGGEHADHRQRMKDRINDRELCWQRFERAQLFHERWVHIQNGTIIPANDPRSAYPQLLVRDSAVAGGWAPEVRVIKHV